MATDQDPITITCPHCGLVSEAPRSFLGHTLKCPECGTRFKAEASIQGPPPAPPASPRPAPGRSEPLPLPADSGPLPLPTDSEPLPIPSGPGPGPPQGPLPLHEWAAIGLSDDDDESAGPLRPRSGRLCPKCGMHLGQTATLCYRCGFSLVARPTEGSPKEEVVPLAQARPVISRVRTRPLSVTIVGGGAVIASTVLLLLDLIQGASIPLLGPGWTALIWIAWLGLAVQFVRGRWYTWFLNSLVVAGLLSVGCLVIYPLPATNLTLPLLGVALVLVDVAAIFSIFTPRARRYFRSKTG